MASAGARTQPAAPEARKCIFCCGCRREIDGAWGCVTRVSDRSPKGRAAAARLGRQTRARPRAGLRGETPLPLILVFRILFLVRADLQGLG
jgi:hypothetical protein